MTNGDWLPTPEPIIINSEGVLDNGHHRLQAIKLSGTTQKMYVVRGTDPTLRLVLDSGRSRTDADSLRMAGCMDATGPATGILRRFLAGNRTHNKMGKPSKTYLKEMWQKYSEIIKWSAEGLPKQYRQAPLCAALARARAGGVSTDILEEFKAVLKSNEDVPPDEESQAAYKLKALIESRKIATGSGSAQAEFYGVALRAIKCFVDGETLPNKKAAKEDYWLIDEDLEEGDETESAQS